MRPDPPLTAELVPDGGTLLVLALVAGALAFRRLRPDRALASFTSEDWTFWQDAESPWWGRLEPRAAGFVLHFERPYAPPGELRRRALVADARTALAGLGLVRAHGDRSLFAELERRELVRRRARRGRAAGIVDELARGLRAALDGVDEALDRALDPERPRPLQDTYALERWRGERVVVELAGGAQVGGLVVEVGRAFVALVAPPGVVRELTATAERPDGPLSVRASAGFVEVRAAGEPVRLEQLRAGERALDLSVTLLPGGSLRMPWDGVPKEPVARARAGTGFDFLLPRATSVVRFAGEEPSDAPTP